MKYSFLKQNRYRILMCEGHRYSRYMTVYNKEYWRCTDRTCKGKLHLSSGRIVYKNNGHSHKPDHKGISADQALVIMRKRARTEETPIRQIYTETIKEYEENGHGPIRESLPYGALVCDILQRVRSNRKKQGGDSVQQQGLAEVERLNQHFTKSNNKAPATEAGHETSDVELEVVDCTNDETDYPSNLFHSTCITTASETIPTSSAMARGLGRFNSSLVSYAENALVSTDTTHTDRPESNATGLTIHSAYSLQTTPIGSITTNQGDNLPRLVDNRVMNHVDLNLHEADNIIETSPQHNGHPGSLRTLQTNSDNLYIKDINNHVETHSFNGSSESDLTLPPVIHTAVRNHLPRQAGHKRSTSQTLAQPNTTLTDPVFLPSNIASQYGDDTEQTYRQFQMRLARKEHQLRVQHMKERHEAEMTLVRLQQELVKEQLRDARQQHAVVNT